MQATIWDTGDEGYCSYRCNYPQLCVLWGWVVKAIRLLPFSWKRTPVPCTESLVSPMARTCSYRGEKIFPLMVFIVQTFWPVETIGRTKENFGICGWKQMVGIKGTTRASACKDGTNNKMREPATLGIMRHSREIRHTERKYRPLNA